MKKKNLYLFQYNSNEMFSRIIEPIRTKMKRKNLRFDLNGSGSENLR